jgi:hypothetical protein
LRVFGNARIAGGGKSFPPFARAEDCDRRHARACSPPEPSKRIFMPAFRFR